MEKKTKKKMGRPLFDGKPEAEVVQKLEQAFALGCTDIEACLYADISKRALYDYQSKHPNFQHRKEMLKEKPVLKARNVIVQALQNNDSDVAKWYLERKAKAEFSNRQEITGADGKGLTLEALILRAVDDQRADIFGKDQD